MLIKILLICSLFFVFYQDVRYRAVYWIVFPILLSLMILLAVQQQELSDIAINSAYNVGFILAQFFLIFVYFSVKARGLVNITSGYLGWGDILFLLCIAFYLSPGNYLLFYILSLIVVLLTTLVFFSFNRHKEIKIPLAGLQAALFAVLLITDWRLDAMNITNDYWVMKYLNI